MSTGRRGARPGIGRKGRVWLVLLAGLVVAAAGSVGPAAAITAVGVPGPLAGAGRGSAAPGSASFRAMAAGAASARPQDAAGSLSTVSVGTLSGGYVAAGIGMRNLGYGTISVTGIPSGATVASATLMWDIVADSAGPAFAQGTFGGSAITGTAWASGASPCWPPGSNFSYVADVTSLVTGNGSYALSGFATGQSDGADPFTAGSAPPLLEGATLVVVYKLASMPLTTIQIAAGADELAGNTATATMTGFTADAHASATTTYIVADGQQTGIKSATFDGTAVPGAAFRGTDPQAVPGYSQGNLWDTTTADVRSPVKTGDTSASLSITSGGSKPFDCVVWVGQVLAVSQLRVGIYSDLKTPGRVTEALGNGWAVLGSVSGLGNPRSTHDPAYRACRAPWTGSTGADSAVNAGVSSYLQDQPGAHVTWVSYWTAAVPPYSRKPGFLRNAGYAAGAHAAMDAARAARTGHVLPAYIALDIEESPQAFSCGINRRPGQKAPKPGDKQCWDWNHKAKQRMNCFLIGKSGWREFALGWAHAVATAVEDLPVRSAIYVTRGQLTSKDVLSFGLPVILAVGLPPSRTPPRNPEIVGYAAFYSACASIPANIARVESWGGSVDTIQLSDKGVDCTPGGMQQGQP